MKSQDKKAKIDKIKFIWDKNAEKNIRAKQVRHNSKCNAGSYFDFLEELKPSLKELRNVKVFKEVFRIV